MDDKIWDYKSKGDDKLSKQTKKDPNIVMTKDTMAKHIIDYINIPDGCSVMEPCLGTSNIYNNFPEKCVKHWCEINKGVDYLECEIKTDYTISNPPFVPRKLFWNFQLKAMELTDKEIHWLINISSLNVFTQRRLREMKDKGWFINALHIVSDKRWFGRYVVVKISKIDNGFLTWCDFNF